MSKEGWGEYAFPKIEFMPCYVPFAGLCEALWERRRLYDPPETEADPDTGEEAEPENPYLPDILTSGGGQEVAKNFDRELWSVARHYVNHLDADFETLETIPFWDRDSLCEALDEDLVDPEKSLLLPEWSVKWALQRYRMIHLLLFAQIDYQCAYMSGNEHTGISTSPDAAISAALEGASISDPAATGQIARTTTTIWGPDHGWDEGTYCADVYQCGSLSAVLPDELADELADADIRLYLSVDSPDANPANFDAYGTGMKSGLNVFYADGDGNFTDGWLLPDSPDHTRVPAKGKTETFGFVARQIFCCADFSNIFKFKNEDD